MFTRGKHSKRYKQWLGLVKYSVRNSSYVHFVHESKVIPLPTAIVIYTSYGIYSLKWCWKKLLHVEIVPDFTLVQTTKICNVHVPLTMKKKLDMLCWNFSLHEEGFFCDNSSK